jgi:hypothetical protein
VEASDAPCGTIQRGGPVLITTAGLAFGQAPKAGTYENPLSPISRLEVVATLSPESRPT